jgi:glucose/arabinose dehydrogenase
MPSRRQPLPVCPDFLARAAAVFGRVAFAGGAALLIGIVNVGAQTVPAGFQYEPVVAGGLQHACAMAFAPDGRLFVCERLTGNVRVVENGQLLPQVWHSVGYTQAPTGESGLLGIAIDPGFLWNRFVYIYYTDPSLTENRIARLVDQNGVGAQATIVTPAGVLATHQLLVHNGGRMVFGHDGRLHVSTGDIESAYAQDLSRWEGKILRFDVPGLTIPASNPIAGSPIYAWGLRNTYGLTVHPEGWMYGTENGYLVGDELNRIVAGGNYGWPQYEGANMPGGFQAPLQTIAIQPVLTGLATCSSAIGSTVKCDD